VCYSGDVKPTTDFGKALVCVLVLVAVLGLAMPVGVIGSELDRA
jgi:hypothetical protein